MTPPAIGSAPADVVKRGVKTPEPCTAVMTPKESCATMGPMRIRMSRFAFAPTVLVSHAHCMNKYSLARLNPATCVDALELWATVVERFVTLDPTIVPCVISVAFAPEVSEARQSRNRARPSWSPPPVTAMTDSWLYQVPAEKSPVVAADRRQQSAAPRKPVAAGAGPPEGCTVVVKVAAAFSVLY